MPIYVLTSGQYSDYEVRAVCSSLENARTVIAAYPKVEWNDPLECELDHAVDAAKNGYSLFHVYMKRNGNFELRVATSNFPDLYGDQLGDALDSYVFAKDEDHAVKIVNEKRARLIASGEWVVDPE